MSSLLHSPELEMDFGHNILISDISNTDISERRGTLGASTNLSHKHTKEETCREQSLNNLTWKTGFEEEESVSENNFNNLPKIKEENYFMQPSRFELIQKVDLVFAKIFEAMDVETLTMCRLVSRRWHRFATRSLRNRTSITIYTHSTSRRLDFNSCFGGTLGIYVHPHHHNHHDQQTFSANQIIMVGRSTSVVSNDEQFSFNKLVQVIHRNMMFKSLELPFDTFRVLTNDLSCDKTQYLFDCIGPSVKRLDLDFLYDHKKRGFENSFMKNIEKLLVQQLPQLEHLRMGFLLSKRWNEDIRRWDDEDNNAKETQSTFFSEAKSLPKLKSLTVHGLNSKRFIKGITKAAKNLKVKPEVHPENNTHHCTMEFLHDHEHDLDLDFDLNTDLDMVINPSSENVPEFKFLVHDIFFDLRSIDAKDLFVAKKAVEKIITQNSHCLVAINVYTCDPELAINFPSLPKLRAIRFWPQLDCDNIKLHIFQGSYVEFDFLVDFNLALANSCYLLKKFPKLEQITTQMHLNLSMNLGLLLSLGCLGPYYSVRRIEPPQLGNFVITDSRREEWSQCFPQASVDNHF